MPGIAEDQKKRPRDLIFHYPSSAAIILYQSKVGVQSSRHRTSALYVAFLSVFLLQRSQGKGQSGLFVPDHWGLEPKLGHRP